MNDIWTQIKERVRIKDIVKPLVELDRYNTGLCPFHSEKAGSFRINPSRGTFKCFGCGVGGDVFTFVELYYKLTPKLALERLKGIAGIAEGPKEKEFISYRRWLRDKRALLKYDFVRWANGWQKKTLYTLEEEHDILWGDQPIHEEKRKAWHERDKKEGMQ